MTKLPHDPLAWNRAMVRAMAPLFLGFALAFELPTVVVGLMLGPLVEPNLSWRFAPWNFALWYYKYGLQTFRSHSLNDLVHLAFKVGFGTYITSLTVTAATTLSTFNKWRTIRTGLDTPYGDARFATIEDLAHDPLTEKPEDSPLPPGYDIIRGFEKEQRAGRQRRRDKADEMVAQRSIYAREADFIANANSTGAPTETSPELTAAAKPKIAGTALHAPIIVPPRGPK